MEEPVEIFAFLLQKLKKNRRRFKQEKFFKRFGSLKTNLERVDFVYEHLLKECPDFPPFRKDEKDDAVAGTISKVGDFFFIRGKYREALDKYTDSISKAKSAGVLALAYGNRSATLSKLNLHEECLADIDRALEHGYPDYLKPKLLERQQHSNARKRTRESYYEEIPTFPDSERNPLIECARDCIKIAKNEQFGRHIVATRDIEIGEILAVEKPYTALVTDEIYVHCHECLELCYNLIPCNSCTKALYCGESCKEKAFATYHKYECPILLSLDSIKLDDPKRLALKIVFMTKTELNNIGTYAAEENEVYRSDRFKEVYSLNGHVEKRDSQNLFARTAVAAGFFHLIKNHTTFLEDGVDENCLKEALLSLILISATNNLDVDELQRQLMSYDVGLFGIANYPFTNLFNHSCWPNVLRNSHGSTVVLRAINSIRKGEQCFVIYGPDYTAYPKQWRQRFLASYFYFNCTCRACKENWPMRLSPGLSGESLFSLMPLLAADVNAAKEEIPRLLLHAMVMEKSRPPGRDEDAKSSLRLRYDILGNKRRI